MKKKGIGVQMWIVAIAALAITGVIVYTQVIAPPVPAAGGGQLPVTPAGSLIVESPCGDDPLPDLRSSYRVPGNGTTTDYMPATCYLQEMQDDGTVLRVRTVTLSPSGTSVFKNNLTCGENTRLCCVTTAGVTSGGCSDWFTVDQAVEDIVIEGNAIAHLQSRVADDSAAAGTYLYQIAAEATHGTNSTSMTSVNLLRLFDTAVIATQEISVASGAQLEATIEMRSGTSYQYAGEVGKSCYVSVDDVADSGNWTTPQIAFDGVTLSEVNRDALGGKADRYTYTRTGDWFYEIPDPQIDAVGTNELAIVVPAAAGQDPNSGDDIRVCLYCEGLYLSATNPELIEAGAINDASTIADVVMGTSYEPCWRFDVE